MTFLDFFAGIGTIRIGFEQAGWTCNGHVEWDKFAQASYNAMHEIKEGEFNGLDIREVRADELPKSDLWAFGAPCQDFSIAGRREGMDGERSSLIREIFRLIEETPEENKPTWLLYENVKGMFSSNRGRDFLGIITEMAELGYDVEWQLLNSKDFGVPQNRERVFTLGHLRGRGGRKVFPITGQGGQADQTVITNVSNNAPKIAIREATKKGYAIAEPGDSINLEQPNSKTRRGRVGKGVANTLTTGCQQGVLAEPKIAIPVSSPDYQTKNQNGRRFKEDGDPMFTLTAQDKHGVVVSDQQYVDGISDKYSFDKKKVQAMLDEKGELPERFNPYNAQEIDEVSPTLTTNCGYSGSSSTVLMKQPNFRIRKLTPKECWRLQGIPDHYFEKASAVNSNTQLYKQAGNACTVNVIYEIAKRI